MDKQQDQLNSTTPDLSISPQPIRSETKHIVLQKKTLIFLLVVIAFLSLSSFFIVSRLITNSSEKTPSRLTSVDIITKNSEIIIPTRKPLPSETIQSDENSDQNVLISQERTEVICTNERYTSKYFPVNFLCATGLKVNEGETSLSVSPVDNEPYTFLYFTQPEITESYWEIDKVKSLTQLKIGEVWHDPDNSDDMENESLERIKDILINGTPAYTFYDDSPYEGYPLYKFVIPYNNSYFFVQIMSLGFVDTAPENHKHWAKLFMDLVLSLQLK